MSNFYEFLLQFATDHLFLFWCSLWLVWGLIDIVTSAFELMWRLLRSINIALRGWPPEHLDAHGIFKQAPKADDSEIEL